MKGPYRLNRQRRHLLCKLSLRGVKAGNQDQHSRARRKKGARGAL